MDSVLGQTFSDLEIILVDDGSPDGCPPCATRIKKRPARGVIHKENGGLSDARNVGLDAARGELIGFADSDDWLEPDMYETLYHAMREQRRISPRAAFTV
jgi:glycosyltransferase involved in cell wall biosynthesis